MQFVNSHLLHRLNSMKTVCVKGGPSKIDENRQVMISHEFRKRKRLHTSAIINMFNSDASQLVLISGPGKERISSLEDSLVENQEIILNQVHCIGIELN